MHETDDGDNFNINGLPLSQRRSQSTYCYSYMFSAKAFIDTRTLGIFFLVATAVVPFTAIVKFGSFIVLLSFLT